MAPDRRRGHGDGRLERLGDGEGRLGWLESLVERLGSLVERQGAELARLQQSAFGLSVFRRLALGCRALEDCPRVAIPARATASMVTDWLASAVAAMYY
jgi:hypothetical protein